MNLFNKAVVGILPVFPKSFIWIFSKKYIAGKSLADGVEKIKELNTIGCCATMDVLGEDIEDLKQAEKSRDESIRVLDVIKENGLDSNLSVKLTSLGLKIDKERCFENVREIVKKAKEVGNFVRIDMEDSTCTDDTLEIYRRLREEFSNVGAVIQAYLHRSGGDVEKLIDEGIANLRVCKGIYNESKEIAFKDREQIRRSYMDIIEMMLDSGSYVGIATHDTVLVERSFRAIEKRGIKKSGFEFQMLLGVTEKLRSRIVNDGNRLRVYVPYGEQWYGYCMRRLKENPRVAGHIIKNIFIKG